MARTTRKSAPVVAPMIDIGISARDREKIAEYLEGVRGVDERLGGDAADVQAGATRLRAFGQHGGNAQLPGADGRHIAAGAAADDQQFG